MEHICNELQSYNSFRLRPRPQDAHPEEMTRYYVYNHAHLQLTSNMELTDRRLASNEHRSCTRAAPIVHPDIDTILEPRLDALQYLPLFPGLSGTWETPLPLTIKELAEFSKSRTSSRVWASLLRQAIATVSTEASWSITDGLSPLTRLLQYNDSPSALTSPMTKLLLSAYIFLASRVDTV